jgi:hypothetical protein
MARPSKRGKSILELIFGGQVPNIAFGVNPLADENGVSLRL